MNVTEIVIEMNASKETLFQDLLQKLNLEFEPNDWVHVLLPSNIKLDLKTGDWYKKEFLYHRHHQTKRFEFLFVWTNNQLSVEVSELECPEAEHAKFFMQPAPLNRPDLGAIVARANATTSGTWTEELDIDYGNHEIVSDAREDAVVCKAGEWGSVQAADNMTFFLHAKTDVLELARYVLELEKEMRVQGR